MPGNPLYCGCDSVPFGPQYPRIAPSGWQFGGSPCGCGRTPCCCNNGPAFQLDANSVIYHKNNDLPNQLGPIGLNNGATLQLFMDTVAAPIGQVMNVPNYTLPFLRAVPFTINTLQQFAQAVDTEFQTVATEIAALTVIANTPLVANDSSTIDFSTSGTLNHTLTGSVKISATANNTLSALGDGLFAAPQTLSYDTVAKTLTISQGNTVNLASLACGVIGFLGNLATDPTGILDGQYWFNTTSSLLKIQVNGVTKTITTT
jgi:hypothetical protein